MFRYSSAFLLSVAIGRFFFFFSPSSFLHETLVDSTVWLSTEPNPTRPPETRRQLTGFLFFYLVECRAGIKLEEGQLWTKGRTPVCSPKVNWGNSGGNKEQLAFCLAPFFPFSFLFYRRKLANTALHRFSPSTVFSLGQIKKREKKSRPNRLSRLWMNGQERQRSAPVGGIF